MYVSIAKKLLYENDTGIAQKKERVEVLHL